MEYLFIFLLQGFGIFFNVMQNVMRLDDAFPTYNWKQIFVEFFKNDWDSLLISAGIVFLHLLVHSMLDYYKVEFLNDLWVILTYYGLTLFLGWGGQRLIYKVFGKTETILNDKVDKYK